jgi:hypothetical protein
MGVYATFFTPSYPHGHKAIVYLRKDNFWKTSFLNFGQDGTHELVFPGIMLTNNDTTVE